MSSAPGQGSFELALALAFPVHELWSKLSMPAAGPGHPHPCPPSPSPPESRRKNLTIGELEMPQNGPMDRSSKNRVQNAAVRSCHCTVLQRPKYHVQHSTDTWHVSCRGRSRIQMATSANIDAPVTCRDFGGSVGLCGADDHRNCLHPQLP